MDAFDSGGDVVGDLEHLFIEHGQKLYDGARAESVTALAHALQCAQLAEWAGAATPLVAAAVLHDIGHFLPDRAGTQDADDIDDAHEKRACQLLQKHFGAAVGEPVRLHVEAKRYLVFAEPAYFATLSSASVHSLDLQGGPMTADEAERFIALPHACDAIALRRWDDLAKESGRVTPPLGYYLALVEQVRIAA